MRYFEIIQQKQLETASFSKVGASKPNKTKMIKIPAGTGPVQVYVRDGKIFVISSEPLERRTQP
ncbi:hypothetical protein [Janthinobacterium sp. J1-1]|uniref:hypothetical protein n=1 Tax=Janthinobacterium sp. J1-1 TaxID=3065910 RepID=UPI002811D2D4|nr:hypothetical protein [Janthinobacterium sp. J1-1]